MAPWYPPDYSKPNFVEKCLEAVVGSVPFLVAAVVSVVISPLRNFSREEESKQMDPDYREGEGRYYQKFPPKIFLQEGSASE